MAEASRAYLAAQDAVRALGAEEPGADDAWKSAAFDAEEAESLARGDLGDALAALDGGGRAAGDGR